ncbi:MAG: hypothetical protein M3P97_03980, partial [Actinomycetota bacterium]|nr:hypothetical protein [Actinomycetota bacterium]
MAEVGPLGQLGRGVLGVVDHHVDVLGQGQGGVVVGTQALGTGAEGDGVVIGEVGEGRGAVADPVAERAAPFVGDLQGQDLEALDLVAPGLQGLEAPRSLQPAGVDGEVRRRHGSGQDRDRVALGGQQDGGP